MTVEGCLQKVAPNEGTGVSVECCATTFAKYIKYEIISVAKREDESGVRQGGNE